MPACIRLRVGYNGLAPRAALGALMAAVVFWTGPAQAANVLVNPGFEDNSGHVIPNGWTRFAPPTAQGPIGNFWVEGTPTNQAGLLHYKQWGASYNTTNNAAGLYQDLSSAPGSVQCWTWQGLPSSRGNSKLSS